MIIRSLLLVILSLCFVAPVSAEEIDQIDFLNLEFNLFELVYLGSEIDGGSGVTVDFNTGPFVWHFGTRVHYFSTFGIYGDVGVGFILFDTYESSAPYTQVFLINSYTIGNYRYEEYEVTRGRCPAMWLHLIEAGVRPFYLVYDSYNYSSVFADFMIYGGYRFVSYYGEIVPMEEFDVYMRGVVGIANRHEEDGLEITDDNDRIIPGFEIGAKWYIFTVDLGYYDEKFYMHMAWRFSITFM